MRTAASGSPRGCVQFTVSGVPSGHAAGFVAWVQMPTTPKARIATPTTFTIAGSGRTVRPARFWLTTPLNTTRR